MKTPFVPLEDHVLIEPVTVETTTKSWIILPESKEKPNKGKVLAVGPWKILENGQRGPMDVKVGDIVYFSKYSPDELEVDDKKYLIIKQNSILVKEQ